MEEGRTYYISKWVRVMMWLDKFCFTCINKFNSDNSQCRNMMTIHIQTYKVVVDLKPVNYCHWRRSVLFECVSSLTWFSVLGNKVTFWMHVICKKKRFSHVERHYKPLSDFILFYECMFYNLSIISSFGMSTKSMCISCYYRSENIGTNVFI